MITWGISGNSHDAALAVFQNDTVVFASHSERFSGKKNDKDLCQSLVDYARRWGEPEQVVWYEKPRWKTTRQLYAGQGFKDNDIKSYLEQWGIIAPISYQWHHESHAAAGFYTSSFSQATVVVVDAIGEWDTLTIWRADHQGLKKLYSLKYPHSLGLWYSTMTQRIGLKPNEEEYILMGMAAYGDPDKLVNRIHNDFFKASTDPVKFSRDLHKGCLDWAPDLVVNDYFDIAAATQTLYEHYFFRILTKAIELNASENLVLMGGCALNCLANNLTAKLYKNTWIMPNPGDAGSSIGAVLAKNKKHVTWPGPYLGYNIEPATSNDTIVDYLTANKICGVAQGPAEFGPRALGNRSLFADPRGNDIKDRVNEIKHRQAFRPFAPMILEELADTYFDMPVTASPYMQYVARCRVPELFPAIVHADNTSRVQTVGKQDNPRVRALLELWYKRTGCPMLLNTSLNIKGQPMVNDLKDAKAFEDHYGVKVFT